MNHIHHDLIVAWAKGAVIESESEGKFRAISSISASCWDPDTIYRIKLEPKPDVVFYSSVPPTGPARTYGGGYYLLFLTKRRVPDNNMKVTIDGETGKLKSAEILVSSKE